MTGWGGARKGAGSKRKTLWQRVKEGSFRSSKHRWLLEEDDSLLKHELDEDDPRLEIIVGLAEVQLEFRDTPAWAPWVRQKLGAEFEYLVQQMPVADAEPATGEGLTKKAPDRARPRR